MPQEVELTKYYENIIDELEEKGESIQTITPSLGVVSFYTLDSEGNHIAHSGYVF